MIINNLLIFSALASIVFILIASDWRMRIAGLSSLYIVGFIVILQVWPIALASVKLISGLMGMALLSTSQLTAYQPGESRPYPSVIVFRLLMAILFWIIISAVAQKINEWLPIPYTNLFIGLSLMSSGIIIVGIMKRFIDTIIGLLTILIGFDIIYSSLEGSALVTGILALITILICLLSGYFNDVNYEEEPE